MKYLRMSEAKKENFLTNPRDQMKKLPFRIKFYPVILFFSNYLENICNM